LEIRISRRIVAANGLPKYPIVISLASEAIRDDEIAPPDKLRRGGRIFAGGFVGIYAQSERDSRGDFAFANELGLHTVTPGLTNWAFNQTITKRSNHRLVSHLPDGALTWRMHLIQKRRRGEFRQAISFLAPHDVWRVISSDATIIAQGDGVPFLAVKPFGQRLFIIRGISAVNRHGGYSIALCNNRRVTRNQRQNIMRRKKLMAWRNSHDVSSE